MRGLQGKWRNVDLLGFLRCLVSYVACTDLSEDEILKKIPLFQLDLVLCFCLVTMLFLISVAFLRTFHRALLYMLQQQQKRTNANSFNSYYRVIMVFIGHICISKVYMPLSQNASVCLTIAERHLILQHLLCMCACMGSSPPQYEKVLGERADIVRGEHGLWGRGPSEATLRKRRQRVWIAASEETAGGKKADRERKKRSRTEESSGSR